MQSNNRISEDIIKIFHNSTGSVQNDINKWTNERNNVNDGCKAKGKQTANPSKDLHTNHHSEKPRHNYIHREKTSYFSNYETTSES